MRTQTTINTATYSLLALAGTTCFLLPGVPQGNQAHAVAPAKSTVKISGTVRDFASSHSDFGKSPSAGNGHYAGNINQQLGPESVPMFVEPTLILTDFKVVGDTVVPNKDFAVKLTVLGSAIYSGSYHRPVTMKSRVGTKVFEPWGLFTTPVNSNLNDNATITGNLLGGKNPRSIVLPDVYNAGSAISICAQSFTKKTSSSTGLSNTHWQTHLMADSATVSDRVYALRNGDPVPNTSGWSGQSSIADYVKGYVDMTTKKMKLAANEVIWLFELGAIDLSTGAADFQDLVILVQLASTPGSFSNSNSGSGSLGTLEPGGYKVTSQWRDKNGNNIAPHLAKSSGTDACGKSIADVMGSAGAKSTGAISNAASFAQWFQNYAGVNMSAHHTIELVDNGDGVFEYKTDQFYPADNILMGNEGDSHNYFFTYQFDIQFIYDQCTAQFFEFQGTDDAWVFVDGKLALDLGGVMPGSKQRADMDRMGLVDGETYTLSFFYAQRQKSLANFHIRTNILMAQPGQMPTISAAFD